MHVREVVKRMLNQIGMLPVQVWHQQIRVPAGGDRLGSGPLHVRLGGEFHADFSLWGLVVAKTTDPGGGGTLYAPLLRFDLEPHSRTFIRDDSGDAIEGFGLETGLW